MGAVHSPYPEIDAAAWEKAVGEINAWRGHALQCFAQAELAVSETLLLMKSVSPSGTTVRLRRLVGQRFEDLRLAVSADGPFATQGAKAAAALEDFRRHESLRALLCHGTAKVALDRQGHWIVILKVLDFRSGAADRSSQTHEKQEAEALLSELRAASQQLGSALQSLRARIKV